MTSHSIHAALLEARAELIEGAGFSGVFTRKNHIDQKAIAGFIGGYGLMPIIECGGGRFEFASPGTSESQSTPTFAFEVFAEDGETVLDLVALPVSDPGRSFTMFGRVGLVGIWEALNPAAYFMDTPLPVHRTVLQWFQSGCKGAAIVDPSVAARQLVETPGRLAAESHAHGRELVTLLKTFIDVNSKVVVRSATRRAA